MQSQLVSLDDYEGKYTEGTSLDVCRKYNNGKVERSGKNGKLKRGWREDNYFLRLRVPNHSPENSCVLLYHL